MMMLEKDRADAVGSARDGLTGPGHSRWAFTGKRDSKQKEAEI